MKRGHAPIGLTLARAFLRADLLRRERTWLAPTGHISPFRLIDRTRSAQGGFEKLFIHAHEVGAQERLRVRDPKIAARAVGHLDEQRPRRRVNGIEHEILRHPIRGIVEGKRERV